jgi:hypothetical protein
MIQFCPNYNQLDSIREVAPPQLLFEIIFFQLATLDYKRGIEESKKHFSWVFFGLQHDKFDWKKCKEQVTN